MQVVPGPPPDQLSPGGWIAAALGSTGVAGLVPAGFAATARVLHPAVRYIGDDDLPVRWLEVAAANATELHPLAQWPGLTGSWGFLGADNQSPLWDDAPAEGHLPTDTASALAAVLARHTSTPEDVWFGLSTELAPDDDEGRPLLVLPDRTFWLLRGPLALAMANLAVEPHEQSANLWWPADRAWFVVTDPDLTSTYLGGSADCIAEILSAPGLEAFPAAAEDPVGPGDDPINPVIC